MGIDFQCIRKMIIIRHTHSARFEASHNAYVNEYLAHGEPISNSVIFLHIALQNHGY